MAKTWVLETHTKGTGANIVPLEEGSPAPTAPAGFWVVEVTTHRVLAEDAGVRATVELLRSIPSITDVAIWIWSEKHGRYVLLTHREQRRLWDLRDAVRP